MIEELRIQNFRCLRDVSVKLGAFTVLLGPNDSGKSSVLDALGLLGSLVRDGFTDANRQLLTDAVWRRDPKSEVSWEVKSLTFSYELAARGATDRALREHLYARRKHLIATNNAGEVRSEPAIPVGLPNPGNKPALAFEHTSFRAFARSLTSSAKYRLDASAIRRVSELTPSPVLSASGSNLASVLDALISGPDRGAIQSLEQSLREAVPTLRGIALRTVEQPDHTIAKALEFTLAGDAPRVTIPASQASEGALMLTAFLALAHGDTPDLLLIEEPENGLHPSRMKTVIDVLRKISTGEVGARARQVIVTTHNPLLLHYVKADEVRVVTRDATHGTTVAPLSRAPDLSRLIEELSAGDLGCLLGEDSPRKSRRP